MSDMFESFDGKRQIRLSTLSKLTTGNAFRLQWYQNHSNFHCYQQILDHVVLFSEHFFLAANVPCLQINSELK
jgi:hypothetical protein